MPVTIRDVAKKAGVSVGLVSRYLNGRMTLPEETRGRIDAAVAALRYVPNALARRLTSGASETLGLVTTDIGYPFFAAIASAAEAEAERHGYSLAIFNSRNDEARELAVLDKLRDRQIDGLLFLTNHISGPRLRDRINEDPRVILIDEDVSGAAVPRLFADNHSGGRAAAEHLLDKGHRHMAVVGGPRQMVSTEERLAGFRAALARHGLDVVPELIICGTFQTSFGTEALERLIQHDPVPTAIFAMADMLAIGILRGAKERGLDVPGDLSLVGFDDLENVDLLSPPLTTVRQSPDDLGRQGVRLLLDMIRDPSVAGRVDRVSVSLVPRESVRQL